MIPARLNRTIFLIFFLITHVTYAQHSMQCLHLETGTIKLVHPGDMLSLKYTGYHQQTSFVRERFLRCDDTCVYVGTDTSRMSKRMLQRLQSNGHAYTYAIYYRDIQAFRHRTIWSEIIKNVTIAGTTIGTFYLISDNSQVRSWNSLHRFLFLSGVGISISIGQNQLFSHRLKHSTKQWVLYPLK